MYNNILIPVVFDDEHAPLEAFKVARQLAEKGAKITLLHVLEDLPGYATTFVAGDFLEQRREDVTERVEAWAKDVPGGVAAVVTGHSARTILDWAENNKSDCIVVRSHKPGVQDYFLGGTAARVVRYAQCAVHVVR